jgi:natural product precursor
MKKTTQKLSLRKLTLSNLSKQSMHRLKGGESMGACTSNIDACPSRMDDCPVGSFADCGTGGTYIGCGTTSPDICDPAPSYGPTGHTVFEQNHG